MKNAFVVIGSFFLLSSLAFAQVQEVAEDSQATSQYAFHFWMDLKLKESQHIFAALAEEDYETIVKSTEGLKTLNALEGFVRRSTPGYRTQLKSFEFAVDEMNKQARVKNIEGVVLGFHQMTFTCVKCHKQLRDQQTGNARKLMPQRNE